ncbi:MAG: hypothetical protein KW788_04645 [Candidatus Doudnabacteria bacterium]|nr:hypothetical protein [Candidatus Doudnabacteria bacterium]
MRNKIKFISATCTVLLALVLSTLPVMAEESTSTTSNTNTGTNTTLEQKHRKQEKIEHERERINGLQSMAKNQIARAQKELDRMQDIITRIKLQRAKLGVTTTTTATATGTEVTPSADLAKIDEMIAKAEELKKKIDTEIADAKLKQAAILGTLPKVEDKIDSSTTVDTSTTAPTVVVQSVREFQASMKLIKKDLNALHQNLQQIVKTMRKLSKSAAVKKEETKPAGTSSEEQENE